MPTRSAATAGTAPDCVIIGAGLTGATAAHHLRASGLRPLVVEQNQQIGGHIRNDANAGVAPGRNQGVRATAAPYVCLLDSDARLQPLALQALVEPFTIDPDIAVAGPVFTDQAPEASGGRAPTLARKAARMLNLRDTYAPAPGTGTGRWWDVDFVIGACQLVRRTAFDAVGGLDEGYFYGPEDVDFCLRLRRARWRVVQVAGARVDHPPRRRHKRAVTLAGVRHGLAVARHHWRHRGFRSAVGP